MFESADPHILIAALLPKWQPLAPPLTMSFVVLAPAPRSVTFGRSKLIPPEMLYVPAFSFTTCPLGQEERALVICPADAPGLRVAQMVVRLGIPPITPAVLQSMARAGQRIPDHAWACAAFGATATKSPVSQTAWRVSTLFRKNRMKFDATNFLGFI